MGPIFIKSDVEFRDQKMEGYVWKVGSQGPGFYLKYKNTDGKIESCDKELPCINGYKKIWTGEQECCKAEKKIDFIKSDNFKGDKDGYEFKAGKKGIGYYLKNISRTTGNKNSNTFTSSQSLKASSSSGIRSSNNNLKCEWDEYETVGSDGKKQCVPNTSKFIRSEKKHAKIKPMYQFFPAEDDRAAGYYKICDSMPDKNGQCNWDQK